MRALVYWYSGRMRVESRNRKEIGLRYPELSALGRQMGRREAVLDGEIVAFDERGLPSFERLQKRMHLTSESAIARAAREIPVTYVIFDLLYLDGRPPWGCPTGPARAAQEVAAEGPAWQAPALREGDGADLLRRPPSRVWRE